MRNDKFEAMVREFRAKQDQLILKKGHDYTVGNGDSDRLWNFKTVGKMLGISPLQCLGVYWLKHVLAICTYIKMGKVESEDIDGRFLDESNYNLLGRALIAEELGDKSQSVPQAERQIRRAVVPSVRKRKLRSKSKRGRNKRRGLSSDRSSV